MRRHWHLMKSIALPLHFHLKLWTDLRSFECNACSVHGILCLHLGVLGSKGTFHVKEVIDTGVQVHLYENLLSGLEPVESQWVPRTWLSFNELPLVPCLSFVTVDFEAFVHQRVLTLYLRRLLDSIVEHLNAEIVLLTVSDCGQAIDWLKCSYLYVRIKKVRSSAKLVN